VDSPEGTLCDNCYSRFYPGINATAADVYPIECAVITCPECRGKHHAPRGKECSSCKGYGVVRIEQRHLAKYEPKDISPKEKQDD